MGTRYLNGVAVIGIPTVDDTYWLGSATVGWKGLHMADTLITDESGYVNLRNNADTAFVGLKGNTIILAPTTTGSVIDLQLETEFVAGTVFAANFASATTITVGSLAGISLDFQTNISLTPGGGAYPYQCNLPVFTQSTADSTTIIGYDVFTSGALVQNTLAGNIYWRGMRIKMPDMTQTTGNVHAAGVRVVLGTYTSGTELVIDVVGNADRDVKLINLAGITGTPYWYWDESADCFGTSKGFKVDSGNLYVGDDSNANMSQGITINQGANTNSILSFKQSNIAHGATTIAETDTFATFGIVHAGGGVQLRSLSDADAGDCRVFELVGYAGVALDTTKSTTGRAVYELGAALVSGTGSGDCTADGNIFALRPKVGGSYLSVLIVDEDGDLWLNASGKGLTFASSVDSAAVADEVTLGAYEISAGHRALAIGTEEVAVVAVAVASTHKIPIRYNGVTLNLLATNV